MAGMRRSEVSALRWADIADAADRDGVLVTVRRGKTNQEGERRDVRFVKDGVARALRTLLRAAAGPVPEGAGGPGPCRSRRRWWGCGSPLRPVPSGRLPAPRRRPPRLEYGGRMVKDQDSPPSLDFQIDASSPSKRPEQFAALLDSALRRPLRRTPGGYGIQRLGKLEKLEDRCGEAAHSRRMSRIQ